MARALEAAGRCKGQGCGKWIRKEVRIEKKRKQVEVDEATHFVQHSFPGGGI
jgi:hypothetical protein